MTRLPVGGFGASTSSFGAAGTCRVFWVGACTLLGPEGPGFGLWDFWAHPVAGLAGGWGGCRPYFENYTVDASILKKTLCMLSGVWGVECSILNGSAHVISSL